MATYMYRSIYPLFLLPNENKIGENWEATAGVLGLVLSCFFILVLTCVL